MSSAVCVALFLVFFFKKETAFEVRISDRSSDLCSSDLFAWHQATYVRCRDGLSILGQEDFVPKAPYTHLLSPGMIGAMRLRNRIIVTAMGVSFAEPDGSWGPRLRAYHEDRKSVVSGKSVSLSVDLGGRRIINKKKN